jgi:hypothetical protein
VRMRGIHQSHDQPQLHHQMRPQAYSMPLIRTIFLSLSPQAASQQLLQATDHRRAIMPTTFPLFPNLPTELRLKIYTHILHLTTPPILKISFTPDYISNTAPPITLSICAESRAPTLEQYSYLQLGPSNLQGPLIPINYSKQTLYISSLTPLRTRLYHSSLLFPNSTPSH